MRYFGSATWRSVLAGSVVVVAVVVVMSVGALGCTNKSVGTPGADAAPWTPPLTNIGTPGWQESEEPWEAEPCEMLRGIDLWSHEGGVYVLNDYSVPFVEPGVCDTHQRLSFNDGTGWQMFYDDCDFGMYFPVSAITGFPDGRLVGSGGGGEPGPVVWIDEGGFEESADIATHQLFVVNDNLAYAVDHEKANRFDGAGWEPVPAYFPYEIYGIWADATELFGVGSNGTIVSYLTGGTEWVVHDTGTIEDLSIVWGFGSADVWVGSAQSDLLLHYDGVAWTPQQWPVYPPGSDASIEGMWGQDGVLFFHTHTQLVRWDGTQFDDLSTWPCVESEHPNGEPYCADTFTVEAIWGNSPTEVFVGVRDTALWPSECQSLRLFWFDGVEYHWF